MKAISGLCCFRLDSPAALPELTGVREKLPGLSWGDKSSTFFVLFMVYLGSDTEGFAQAVCWAVLVAQLAKSENKTHQSF